MPKRSIRRSMLAHRKALSAEEFASASLLVQETFLATENYHRSRSMIVYSPINLEVDTGLIVSSALASGKRVAFPVVAGHELVFREVTDLSQLRKGAFGILEPGEEGRPFMLEEADLLILPGVAFDLKGHRIGYGKGYYDKTIHSLEGSGKIIGICFDFQLVDEILGESHDVKMDLIITEKRVVCPLTA